MMSEDFDEILSAALSLSPRARAMLADHLLESLDDEDQNKSPPFGLNSPLPMRFGLTLRAMFMRIYFKLN
jgi:hypothetical protein